MLMDEIVGGATGDLAILSAEAIDDLIAQGVMQKGSRVDLANPRSASRSAAARWRPISARPMR